MKETDRSTVKDFSTVRRVFLLCLLVLCAVPLAAQGRKDTSKPSPSPTATPSTTSSPSPGGAPVSAIPLPEIALKATELKIELRGYEDQLNRDKTLEAIEQALKVPGVSLDEEAREVDRLIRSAGGYNDLLDLEQLWTARTQRNEKWHETLTNRSNAVLQTMRKLVTRRDEWTLTRNQAAEAGVLEQVAPAIESALAQIETTGKRAHDQLNFLLGVQDRLSRDELTALEVLGKLQSTESSMKRNLWIRDTPPLWNIKASFQTDNAVPRRLAGAVEYNTSRIGSYLSANIPLVLFFIAVFLTAFAISLKLRRAAALTRAKSISSTDASREFFMHPIAVAFLVSFTSVLPAMVGAPVAMRGLLLIGLLIATLRLLPSQLSMLYRKTLYLLVLFLVGTAITEAGDWSVGVKRWALLILSVIAVSGTIVLLRRSPKVDATEGHTPWVSRAILVAVVLVIITIIANIFGFFSLSFLLKNAVILTSAFGAALYTGYLVSTSLIDKYLLVRRKSFISLVQTNHDDIMKWVRRFLALAFFLLWISGVFEFLAIQDQVYSWLTSILALQVTLGSVTITLSDVLTFLGVFIGGMLIATLIRFVLRVDVLGRFNLKHGIPYAIATITYYVMVLLVFLLAVAASGVELSRFTLLTGAFGIGAGFGLQNIIGNFVAGIILLFERPVRIGDSLEVGPTSGEVERIGMRSTSIRTWEGAEVIVPNSDLISQQVVNWTLTRPRRRIELRVRVVLGSEPSEVISVLEDVAREHHDVLKDPPPNALFFEFGDGSLDFVLRAWVLQSSGHERVKSELGVSVVARLKEKGIAVPLRQHNLLLRSQDEMLPELSDEVHR